jgi:hypothetical protein
MDHILENEGKPVPSLSDVTNSASGSSAQPMDVDEDEEDAEALRALTGKAGSAAVADVEAKVRLSRAISYVLAAAGWSDVIDEAN